MTLAQQRLFERAAVALGPGVADYYRDACLLMNADESDIAVSAKSHLVAFLMRECATALRDVATTAVMRDGELDGKALSRAQVDAEADVLAGRFGVDSSELFRARIRDALNAARADSWNSAAIAAVSERLRLDESVAKVWHSLTRSISRLVHRDGLRPPRRVDEEFLSTWRAFQVVLTAVVDRIEATSLAFFDIIDEAVASDRPHIERVSLINGSVPRSAATVRHLFSQIAGPEWLAPLAKFGYFPPLPRVSFDGEGRAIFPPYVPGRYLVSVAADAPQAVVDVLRTLDVGDNDLALSDLIETAAQLPIDLLSQSTDMILGWLRGAKRVLDEELIASLVARLIDGGCVDAAFGIAEVLLEIRGPAGDEPDAAVSPPMSAVRLRDYQYARALEAAVPPLLNADPVRTVQVLSALLANAVGAPPSGGRGDFFDGSPIWLHRVDLGPADWNRDPKAILATVLRDTARSAVETRPRVLQAVFEELMSAKLCVTHRVALDLLVQNLPRSSDLAESQLRAVRYYADPGLAQEFSELFTKTLPHLGLEKRVEILAQLDSPDIVSRWAVGFERANGRPPTPHETDVTRRRRLRDWYALAGDNAPPEQRARLAELVEALGPPDGVVAFGEIETRWGSESPVSVDEALSMEPGALIGFLRRWEPETQDHFFGPSFEGLAQTIRSAASTRPTIFDGHLPEIEVLEPTYVRAVLQGWREALTNERSEPPPVASVLELCRHVARQPGDGSEVQPFARDSGWRWAKNAALDLIREMLERGKISLDQREVVWEVIVSVSDDLNPSRAHEVEFGGRGRKAVSLSLNSTRGKAVYPAFAFYVWVLREEKWELDTTPALSRVLEVRDLLHRRLDPSFEESAAVRAAIGMHLPLLLQTDRAWLIDSLRVLFPHGADLGGLSEATWDGYISQGTVPPGAVEVFGPQYAAAIERVSRNSDGDSSDVQRLFQHLFLCFVRDPTSEKARELLWTLVDCAPPQARYFALLSVGSYLGSVDGDVDPRVTNGLQELWTARLLHARKSGNADELMAFGSWFSSGRFPEEWALAQLNATMALAGAVDDGHNVVARLLAGVAIDPLLAVSCLGSALLSHQDMVHRYPFQMGARPVLEAVLSSDSVDATREARDLVNRLAARGDSSFRDLLM